MIFSVLYKNIITVAEKFVPPKMLPFWNHPCGPKTVFFWSPLFKWCLVLAGIGDLQRPVEKLSVPQSGALMATGFIWSRYSLVIIPKNWNLFAVNFSVGLTGLYQCSRIYMHKRSQAAIEGKPESEEKAASEVIVKAAPVQKQS
ncbi:hypothetical protein ScPMuIL_013248 [Solemya velum]